MMFLHQINNQINDQIKSSIANLNSRLNNIGCPYNPTSSASDKQKGNGETKEAQGKKLNGDFFNKLSGKDKKNAWGCASPKQQDDMISESGNPSEYPEFLSDRVQSSYGVNFGGKVPDDSSYDILGFIDFPATKVKYNNFYPTFDSTSGSYSYVNEEEINTIEYTTYEDETNTYENEKNDFIIPMLPITKPRIDLTTFEDDSMFVTPDNSVTIGIDNEITKISKFAGTIKKDDGLLQIPYAHEIIQDDFIVLDAHTAISDNNRVYANTASQISYNPPLGTSFVASNVIAVNTIDNKDKASIKFSQVDESKTIIDDKIGNTTIEIIGKGDVHVIFNDTHNIILANGPVVDFGFMTISQDNYSNPVIIRESVEKSGLIRIDTKNEKNVINLVNGKEIITSADATYIVDPDKGIHHITFMGGKYVREFDNECQTFALIANRHNPYSVYFNKSEEYIESDGFIDLENHMIEFDGAITYQRKGCDWNMHPTDHQFHNIYKSFSYDTKAKISLDSLNEFLNISIYGDDYSVFTEDLEIIHKGHMFADFNHELTPPVVREIISDMEPFILYQEKNGVFIDDSIEVYSAKKGSDGLFINSYDEYDKKFSECYSYRALLDDYTIVNWVVGE